tara:strand:- start:545 stop:1801 length:1257 start_codon:yes stop_codon:yes gene_type:complete
VKSLTWALALRFLLSPISSLSYVSKLALTGLIVSTGVLLLVLSVVNGFDRELRERVLGITPHFSVALPGGAVAADIQTDIELLTANGIQHLVPAVHGTAILAANDTLATVQLKGIDPQDYALVSDIGSFLTSGSQSSARSENPLAVLQQQPFAIVIGATLAKRLGVAPGDAIVVMLAEPKVSIVGPIIRQKRFVVVDVFDSGSQLDGQGAFIGRTDAQRLLQLGQRVNAVEGRLADIFDFAGARQFLYTRFADASAVRSWMTTYGNLYQAIAIQKVTMFGLFSLLIGVAAFNLISSLMMLVERHKADVAILRSMGATNSQIVGLFCCLGMLLGGVGIFLGLVIGWLAALGLAQLFPFLQWLSGADLMSQYFISYLPVDVQLLDAVSIFVLASVLAFVASVYPAWRAAKLLPSRVLAYE